MKKNPSARLAETVRRPVAAGIFYPDDRAELKDVLERLVGAPAGGERPAAIVVPHGAFRWAGGVMGAAYTAVSEPAVTVVVGPSHTGTGARFGIGTRSSWETPLGLLPVEGRLARKLLQRVSELERDDASQREEHSMEVQLPFLQRLGVPGFVPVTLGSCDAVTAERIGDGIGRVLLEWGQGVLLVATANWSRYVAPERVPEQDRWIQEAILALDGEQLLQAVREKELSMCGAEATAVVLAAAKRLGARRAVQAGYEVHRDTASAVSAASFVLQR